MNPSHQTQPDNPLKWMITISVMLVTVIEVLDMTIVNVALPHMMGSLGANSEQITWILTAYIVSSAIFMPLTGFLVSRLGRKRLLLINIVGFLLSSVLCGLATSLEQLVFFRVLQGIFGASLVPLSQFIMRDTFPPEEHGKAMAIWGMGIMTAPVLGPTIGGLITENTNWRWIFYINVPVCILAFFMSLRFVSETKTRLAQIDWLGLMLMAVGVGCLQVFLDKGNEKNWLDNNFVCALLIIWIISLSVFIIRGIKIKNNIVNLHLFRDRNYALSTLTLTIFMMSFLGCTSIQPLMLQQFLNYPTDTAGMVMAPRGIASAFAMFIGSRLMPRIGCKATIFMGVCIYAVGSYIASFFNLEMGYWLVICSSIIQGLGVGLFFVPLSVIAYFTLPRSSVAEAAGLYSFGRSLGGSIGISLMSTILNRLTQINWNRLGGNLTHYNQNLQYWLNAQNLDIHQPTTIAKLAHVLEQQAGMVAFVDVYWLATFIPILVLPLILLLKEPAGKRKKPGGTH